MGFPFSILGQVKSNSYYRSKIGGFLMGKKKKVVLPKAPLKFQKKIKRRKF